jgi:16S rRNA processing protein RimM
LSARPTQISAGRVGRPHGLDGSFHVTRPKGRLLTVGTTVDVGARSAAIARRSGTDERPIVRLEGFESRVDAEALRGTELLVAAERAPELGENEWWEHELRGCEVVDGARRLGTVTRLLELPSCEALEVCASDGATHLVPMVKDAIREVRIGERRIEVDLEFLGIAGDAGPQEPQR